MDGLEFLDQVEAEVIRRGGGAKRGSIARWELEAAQEIRVSIRPPRQMSSTELFTLRKLEPGEYHLMLIAVPRKAEEQNANRRIRHLGYSVHDDIAASNSEE
ncbi:MAG: hypothetical protein JW950_06475 [Deltaproteobacteria bacterium]|nr:hypothetical protein [Deltaproteobacteria bacterium]